MYALSFFLFPAVVGVVTDTTAFVSTYVDIVVDVAVAVTVTVTVTDVAVATIL